MYSAARLNRDNGTNAPCLDSTYPNLLSNDRLEKHTTRLFRVTEQALRGFLGSIKRTHTLVVDYKTYNLAIFSSRFDKTVSSYISK